MGNGKNRRPFFLIFFLGTSTDWLKQNKKSSNNNARDVNCKRPYCRQKVCPQGSTMGMLKNSIQIPHRRICRHSPPTRERRLDELRTLHPREQTGFTPVPSSMAGVCLHALSALLATPPVLLTSRLVRMAARRDDISG